jgi:hypothetical protein
MFVLATNALGFPVPESAFLVLGPLRAIHIIGVHLLVLLLLLLGEILPVLTLFRGKTLPLLADRLGQIGLPLLLAEAVDCLGLGLLAIFTAFAAEEDEGVLGSFDVVLVALFGTTLEIGTTGRLASLMKRW